MISSGWQEAEANWRVGMLRRCQYRNGKWPSDADVSLNRNNLLARTGVPEYYFLLVTIASSEITGCDRMLGLAVETRATPIGPGALRHGFFTERKTQGSFSV
jgi:hypothetical protein